MAVGWLAARATYDSWAESSLVLLGSGLGFAGTTTQLRHTCPMNLYIRYIYLLVSD